MRLSLESSSTTHWPTIGSTDVIENLSTGLSGPEYLTLSSCSPTVILLKLPFCPKVDSLTRQLLEPPITHVPSGAITLNRFCQIVMTTVL